MVKEINRFDVFLIALDPTQGSELKKIRPCIVVSPDEMNVAIQTVIVAPLTTKIKQYPTRITWLFDGKMGQVVLDQIRVVDKGRLIKKIGIVPEIVASEIAERLVEMFEY